VAVVVRAIEKLDLIVSVGKTEVIAFMANEVPKASLRMGGRPGGI